MPQHPTRPLHALFGGDFTYCMVIRIYVSINEKPNRFANLHDLGFAASQLGLQIQFQTFQKQLTAKAVATPF